MSRRESWGKGPGLEATLRTEVLQLGFQSFEVQNQNPSTIHVDEFFRLETAQIARHKLAYSSYLRRELLVATWQCNLNSPRRARPLTFRETNQISSKTMANGGKRKFFDNPDQTPQPGAHDA